ncbi:hypothetical protein A3842_06685 [Paenibacillus sp. P3E]|uniref:hypothetical protein n=1 Tax=Paenibacillus sp. P3E TaxID=1349435 RepID=UPI00093E0662|nr:hypothetical protein [Paenibacillus sp. P3E]OKP86088.1 hypothetical protein A3842_06685 [Paenibacillus sp. P3E]
MLKLMKYDLKRRQERILAFFVIMLLVQAGIWISNSSMGVDLLSYNMMAYGVFGCTLLLFAFFNYIRYLKSYARRLVPVGTLQNVLSPLLLNWILLLLVTGLAAIHLGLYILVYSSDFLPVNFWRVASWCIFNLLWTAGFELILLMFAVTIAKSLRVKGTIWIAIAVFAVIENGISFIENQFWGSYISALNNAFQFKVYEASAIRTGLKLSDIGTNFWALIFEAAVGAILIYVMKLLIQKRIED